VSRISDLVRQVELLEDHEQSSEALMELVHMDAAVGAKLALNLLLSAAGDVHLRAFAFNMLYTADREAAFDFIRKNAASSEPQVFAAILTEVTDDVGVLQESVELQQVVQFLLPMARSRRPAETGSTRDTIDSFLAIYPRA
jgi:hypothetical protein